MTPRNLTIGIGGAVTLLLTTWISRVTGLVTDDQIIFAFFAGLAVTLSAGLSYIISWAATDNYKKYNWPPNRWKEQAIKRRIFKFAWWSAGTPMVLLGAAILTFSTTGKLLIVGIMVWSILAACVAATSPWLWCFVFDNLLPRLRRWARGQDENEAEAEALSRPPEPK